MENRLSGERLFDRCAYQGCQNGRFSNGKRLFRFPQTHNNGRLEAWLTNCGNEKIRSYSALTIRRHGLCADHFTLDSFTTPQLIKLKRDAIPVKPNVSARSESTVNSATFLARNQIAVRLDHDYECADSIETDQPDNVISPTASVPSETRTLIPLVATPSIEKSIPPPKQSIIPKEVYRYIELEKLRTENRILRKEVQYLRMELRRKKRSLAQQVKIKKQREIKNPVTKQRKLRIMIKKLLEDIDISPMSKTLISLQMHKSKAPYTDDEKNFVMQLYFQSPNTLKHLLKAGCNFPGETTIRSWLNDHENTDPKTEKRSTDVTFKAEENCSGADEHISNDDPTK